MKIAVNPTTLEKLSSHTGGAVADPRFQLTLGGNALVLFGALVLELFFALHAGKDHHVHGKAVGAQMGVDEVDGEDEQDGEQPFFAVNHQHGVQRPAGQKVGKERGKPHGVA